LIPRLPAPASCRWVFDAAPSRDDRQVLARAIDAFNGRRVPYAHERFAIYLRDGADRIRAGIDAILYWEWIYVDNLWVEDALQRRGIGRALLLAAEARAAAQGCRSAWLETFQARDFYLGLGYEVFGTLPDYPPGQTRYFLKKRLAARAE
jgi:ribosomal protein S18 acetylase RimI-like enzyme